MFSCGGGDRGKGEERAGQEGRERPFFAERVQRLLACWGTPMMTGGEQVLLWLLPPLHTSCGADLLHAPSCLTLTTLTLPPLPPLIDPAHPQERLEIEMAELDAEEAKLIEAEEEELWMLTLQQQARHIAHHIEFDLPQSVATHMDPLLYKKLDWELTHGQDLLHHEAAQAADCEQVRTGRGAGSGVPSVTCMLLACVPAPLSHSSPTRPTSHPRSSRSLTHTPTHALGPCVTHPSHLQGEFIKDQMGLEHLSHHFLPLLRYRRQKYRKTLGYYPPELSSVPVKAKVVL